MWLGGHLAHHHRAHCPVMAPNGTSGQLVHALSAPGELLPGRMPVQLRSGFQLPPGPVRARPGLPGEVGRAREGSPESLRQRTGASEGTWKGRRRRAMRRPVRGARRVPCRGSWRGSPRLAAGSSWRGATQGALRGRVCCSGFRELHGLSVNRIGFLEKQPYCSCKLMAQCDKCLLSVLE